MDALAVAGIEIVVRSRFTGLCFFTVTCLSELFIIFLRECTEYSTPDILQYDFSTSIRRRCFAKRPLHTSAAQGVYIAIIHISISV